MRPSCDSVNRSQSIVYVVTRDGDRGASLREAPLSAGWRWRWDLNSDFAHFGVSA